MGKPNLALILPFFAAQLQYETEEAIILTTNKGR